MDIKDKLENAMSYYRNNDQLSIKEIAEMFDVNYITLYKRIKGSNEKYLPTKTNKSNIIKAIEYYNKNDNVSIKQVADMFEINYNTMCRHINKSNKNSADLDTLIPVVTAKKSSLDMAIEYYNNNNVPIRQIANMFDVNYSTLYRRINVRASKSALMTEKNIVKNYLISNDKEKINYSFTLNEDLFNAFSEKCDSLNLTKVEVVRQIIENFLGIKESGFIE